MAVFFTVDSDNKVTNIIESETALLSDWIAMPDGQAPNIGATWDSQTQTFTAPAAPSLSVWENRDEAIRLLAESDWTQLPDIGLTTDNVIDWRTYRASLRAIAKSPSAGALTWPTIPSTEYL